MTTGAGLPAIGCATDGDTAVAYCISRQSVAVFGTGARYGHMEAFFRAAARADVIAKTTYVGMWRAFLAHLRRAGGVSADVSDASLASGVVVGVNVWRYMRANVGNFAGLFPCDRCFLGVISMREILPVEGARQFTVHCTSCSAKIWPDHAAVRPGASRYTTPPWTEAQIEDFIDVLDDVVAPAHETHIVHSDGTADRLLLCDPRTNNRPRRAAERPLTATEPWLSATVVFREDVANRMSPSAVIGTATNTRLLVDHAIVRSTFERVAVSREGITLGSK